MWGMSAGGQFNYEFTAWKPERVAAFIVNKGGIYYSALVSKAARAVPGLLFVGGNDLQSRIDTITGLFAVNRRGGAVWALVVEPGLGHVVGQSKDLGALFFEDVLDDARARRRIHRRSEDVRDSAGGESRHAEHAERVAADRAHSPTPGRLSSAARAAAIARRWRSRGAKHDQPDIASRLAESAPVPVSAGRSIDLAVRGVAHRCVACGPTPRASPARSSATTWTALCRTRAFDRCRLLPDRCRRRRTRRWPRGRSPMSRFALNYALGSGTDSTWGYHAVNLAIHLLAGLLLFGIVRRSLHDAAAARPLRRRLVRVGVCDRGDLAGSSAAHAVRDVHRPARRVADGAVLPGDDLLRHSCRRDRLLGVESGRSAAIVCVRARHGHERNDGHRADHGGAVDLDAAARTCA